MVYDMGNDLKGNFVRAYNKLLDQLVEKMKVRGKMNGHAVYVDAKSFYSILLFSSTVI